MTFWRRSIQWQLTLSMGAALVISGLIIIGIYAYALNKLTDKYLLQQAMPASVDAIRNDLERLLIGPLTAAESLAGNTMVEDWLNQGEAADQQPAFIRYLAKVQQQQHALTSFIVVKDSGHYFTNKGLDRTLQPGVPDNQWFYDFVNSGQNQALDIDIDKTTKVPTLFINQRIAVNGKVLGLAGLGYSMKSMSELIRNFHFGEHGQVYLVDQQGDIKIHPDTRLNEQEKLSAYIGTEASGQLLGKAGSQGVRFSRDGEDYIAVAKPVDSLGWVLISEAPLSEIYGPAKQVLLMISAISLAVVGAFLLLMVWLARGLVRPIKGVTVALRDIGNGDGDLTRRLDDRRQDELGDLAKGFNGFVESLRALIGDALDTSHQLHRNVQDVARIVASTAGRAHQQQQMTDMVATAVNEMGLTVQEIANSASATADVSRQTYSEATNARTVVDGSIRHINAMAEEITSASAAVETLATQVATIDEVLSVIRSISEQTNLLALNAAIEAARAGEMGRGFAVVADEVRTLAGRTQSATTEIQSMIGQLKSGAEQAVQSMRTGLAATETGVQSSQRTGDSLGTIAGHIEELTDRNHQIATATEEQTTVTEDINRNVQGIADLAQATAQDVKACQDDCQKLNEMADHLKRQMARFKL